MHLHLFEQTVNLRFAAHRTLNIALCVTFCHILALVMELLTFTQADLHLDVGTLEIKGQRDQRIALLFHQTKQPQDLFFVHQQSAHTQRILIEDVTLLIRADMHLLDQQLTVFDVAPGILQVGAMSAQSLLF